MIMIVTTLYVVLRELAEVPAYSHQHIFVKKSPQWLKEFSKHLYIKLSLIHFITISKKRMTKQIEVLTVQNRIQILLFLRMAYFYY